MDEAPRTEREHRGLWFRLLGLLPLCFFLLHAHFYWTHGGVAHLLWMCNMGDVVLGVGLFLDSAMLIRLAVIWLIPGLPLWFVFVVLLQDGFLWTSLFSHAGGLVVGLVALRVVRAGRWTWFHATVWYLILQQISRMVTPPELNVNVAHRVYAGFEGAFSSYWEYWLLMTLLVAVGAWLLGFALWKLVPPRTESDQRAVPTDQSAG